jgi:hypothetical protein
MLHFPTIIKGSIYRHTDGAKEPALWACVTLLLLYSITLLILLLVLLLSISIIIKY